MSEENKRIARRFIDDGFVKGDAAAIEETLAENAVDHNPMPDQKPGRAGIMQAAEMWRSAFADLQAGIQHQVAEGDYIVQRGLASGTHTGDLMGIAPTGKKVTAAWMDMYRIENGKIAEMWHVEDVAGTLQQLGVMPG